MFTERDESIWRPMTFTERLVLTYTNRISSMLLDLDIHLDIHLSGLFSCLVCPTVRSVLLSGLSFCLVSPSYPPPPPPPSLRQAPNITGVV